MTLTGENAKYPRAKGLLPSMTLLAEIKRNAALAKAGVVKKPQRKTMSYAEAIEYFNAL